MSAVSARIRRRWEAILLAAGASTRMGRPKALLPWSGKQLLGHQVDELLAGRIQRVVVVLGARSEMLADDPRLFAQKQRGCARVVVNTQWALGKCGSIRMGAEALADGVTDVVVLAVDQPTRAEVLEALMGAHEKVDAHCTVPLYNGRRGHPVLLSARYTSALTRLSEENQGMRALVVGLEQQGLVHELPLRAPCVRWDVNRPDDLNRVRAHAW